MRMRRESKMAYAALSTVAALTSTGIWVLMVADEGRSVAAATFEMLVKFTNLTVMLVAVIAAWIALDGPSNALRTVAHLMVIVMAVVTTVVNATLLDPALPPGWWGVVDLFQHWLIPLALVALWAVLGPRIEVPLHRLGGIVVIPFLWLVFVLTRGSMTDRYPYDFLDVGRNGWPSVLAMAAAVLIAMVTIGLALTTFDRRRT